MMHWTDKISKHIQMCDRLQTTFKGLMSPVHHGISIVIEDDEITVYYRKRDEISPSFWFTYRGEEHNSVRSFDVNDYGMFITVSEEALKEHLKNLLEKYDVE